MYYLSGNERGSLLGVVDTEDNVEEFYDIRDLVALRYSLGIEIIHLNKELEEGYTFRTECFKCTLIKRGDILGWELSHIGGNEIFSNKSSYLGYPVISLSSCFRGYKNSSIDVSGMDTSSVIDMHDMFAFCRNLTSLDLSNFDTSSVTNMSDMFNVCISLTSLDLSNFDTKKVSNMSGMFDDCASLTSLDLSNFTQKRITNMRAMFCGCSSLVNLNISKLYTSNVRDMYSMFYGCKSLTSLDLSNFDTSKVKDMANMFYNCDSLRVVYMSSQDLLMELLSGCDSVLVIVPKSSSIKYNKILKGKSDIAKCVLSGQKGVVALEDY